VIEFNDTVSGANGNGQDKLVHLIVSTYFWLFLKRRTMFRIIRVPWRPHILRYVLRTAA